MSDWSHIDSISKRYLHYCWDMPIPSPAVTLTRTTTPYRLQPCCS